MGRFALTQKTKELGRDLEQSSSSAGPSPGPQTKGFYIAKFSENPKGNKQLSKIPKIFSKWHESPKLIRHVFLNLYFWVVIGERGSTFSLESLSFPSSSSELLAVPPPFGVASLPPLVWPLRHPLVWLFRHPPVWPLPIFAFV